MRSALVLAILTFLGSSLVALGAQSFPVSPESLSQVASPDGRPTAIVVGAGPAGLMSALTLQQQGFRVIVLEKRAANYTRLNILGLKVESEAMLHELGILDEFRRGVGTEISRRRLIEMSGDAANPTLTTTIDEEIPHQENPPDSNFQAGEISSRFKGGAQYIVVTGEMEQFLATKARERGIDVVYDANVQVKSRGTHYSVDVSQGAETAAFPKPDIVILADGAHAQVAPQVNFRLPRPDHPSEGEHWIFGDVQYDGERAFNTMLKDTTASGQPVLVNVHFNPRHHRAGVTVSVTEGKMTPGEMSDLIRHYARVAYAAEGIQQEPTIVSMNESPVTIRNYTSSRFIDRNLISVGDRGGASSPLSGMGATLSMSSYAAAVRDFARASGQAVWERARRIRCIESMLRESVAKWLDSAAEAKGGKAMLPRKP